MSAQLFPVPARFGRLLSSLPAADVNEIRKSTDLMETPADSAHKSVSKITIRVALAPPPQVPLAQVWREETTSYYEGPLND